MNQDWRSVRLRDVARLINGRAYKKAELLREGKYPVLRVGNFFTNQSWYYSDLELEESRYCDRGDLLYAWSASFGPRVWEGGKVIFHYHIWKVDFDPKQIEKRFLYYWFEWDKEKIKKQQGAGTTMIHVTKGSMEERPLLLPMISKQKRIVAILDEAFSGIETAFANTEKNLANARELFESFQGSVFSQRGEGWISKALGECFRLRSGDGLTSKQMRPGAFPVFGGNGIAGTHDEFNLAGSNVIVGRVGALCGNARHINRDVWLTDNAFKIVDKRYVMHDKFLVYLLNFHNLRRYARQAAQPVISNSSLKGIVLSFPESEAGQIGIVEKLDALRNEIAKVESIYQQKLTALAELKQSLLQKAFSGELTADRAEREVEWATG